MARLTKVKLERTIELNLPPEMFNADMDKLRDWACERMIEYANNGAKTSAANMAYMNGYRTANQRHAESVVR